MQPNEKSWVEETTNGKLYLIFYLIAKFIEPEGRWVYELIMKLRKDSPRYCGYPLKNPEFFELRWDFVDCILGCEFCWNSASRLKKMNEPVLELSATKIISNTLDRIKNPLRSFLRFTGGETTLYWNELLQVFEYFATDEIMVKIPILIRTNGISMGMGTTNLFELNRFPFNELKFLFELSIKGTNSEEFELLTRTSKKLYNYQLSAYKMLKNSHNHNPNLSFVTVLGLYHSSVNGNRSKFAFVYPSDQTLMFDGYRPWDKQFEKIWNEAERKWVEPLRTSPKELWEKVLHRCGPEGAGLLKYFPKGVAINPRSIFPVKPKGYEYASAIVNNQYW